MSYEITAVGEAADAARAEASAAAELPDKAAVDTPAVDSPEGGTDKPAEVTDQADPADKTSEDDPAPVELFFGGESVSVEVPDDIQAAFTEKGLDAQAVVAELFAKDGDFSLSEETRSKLDEAFGKPLVDAYLNLYKGQNNMALKQFKADAEAEQATITANTASFNELVGGDEGWDKLAAWAGDNLSDAELESFNVVMALDGKSFAAQRLVTEALVARYQAANKAEESDVIKLLTDTGGAADAPSSDLPSKLSRQEFQALLGTEKYKKDPAYAAAIDNIRRASAAKGL